MRLKTSPKEALSKLDTILYKGYELLDDPLLNTPFLSNESSKALDDWIEDAMQVLSNTFIDFSTVYPFLIQLRDYLKEYSTPMKIGIESGNTRMVQLINALNVLSNLCKELTKQVHTPLYYVPDTAKICFYAAVCTLEPDSNEDCLCRYMYQNYSFFEWVGLDIISVEGFGSEKGTFDKKDKTIVVNAMEGVNTKTNTNFGFPVFKKSKAQICLNIPNRFLREEVNNMSS